MVLCSLIELISCSNLSYRQPWHDKLPSHCHSLTVLDYESADPTLKDKNVWNFIGFDVYIYIFVGVFADFY
jgi:hypothetical protein